MKELTDEIRLAVAEYLLRKVVKIVPKNKQGVEIVDMVFNYFVNRITEEIETK